MFFDVKVLDQFPTDPGVYLMKDREGKILYVGKAKNLKTRIKQYFARGRDSRIMVPVLTSQIAHIETIIVTSEKEALLLENTLIKRHQPKYNALLKDDKTFISLMINHKHKWPMIKIVRTKGKTKQDGLYFGPYTNGYAARQTWELLTRIFPLRQCSDGELLRRTRPCLLYSIKRCIAPCVDKCTKEEYDTFVNGAIQFLKGQDKEILARLKGEMNQASEALEFEKAGALLTTIHQIEDVLGSKQAVVKTKGEDCDALGIYRTADEVILMQLIFREGRLIGSEHYSFSKIAEEDDELLSSFILQHYKQKAILPKEILLPMSLKQSSVLEEILERKTSLFHPQKGNKKALVQLAMKNAKATFAQEKDLLEIREKMLLDMKETLKLTRFPERIECFDTSNISGTDLVASMVAFTHGEYDKKRKRLFNIKGVQKSDDYKALHEVLTRRLIRAKEEEDLPDLIIVDGGKGQLTVALDVFKELDIASVDLLSVVKESGRHDKGMTAERVFLPHQSEAISFPPTSPILFLLQKIRDEAHRAAIGFHRKKRSERTLTSALDAIPGIGPKKKQALLRHFGSLKQIQAASEEELKKVPGITPKDIQALKNGTH
jgi:excinuclease ABC subunit C